MLKKLISNKIFWIFIVLHLFLFNINYAEWGDTYRILRASEYIREGTYPTDEKRPPLFSAALAIRPANIDQIFWGRLEMFLFSAAAFTLFFLLLEEFQLKKQTKEIALWLFALNPVFLYWSLRIYADVPFTVLVLWALFLYKKWSDNLDYRNLLSLGIISGLAILMRFEGYLLTGAIGLAIIFNNLAAKDFKLWEKEKFMKALIYGFSALFVIIPWLVYRNPLTSSYLSEPSGRAYDINTLLIYLASLVFLFGFISAYYFLGRNLAKLKKFLLQNPAIGLFVIFELILALLWPAAIPRLFVPAIPFLIIPLAMFINHYFSSQSQPKVSQLFVLFSLLGIYLIAQFFLRLQFLILIKTLLAAAVFVQIFNLVFIFLKKEHLFKISLLLSLLIWSLASIWLHKDIFKAVVEANSFAAQNLRGNVAYNDVSSVSDWYLNQKGTNEVRGFYLNMDDRQGRSYANLLQNEVDYVLITNEHNPTLEFSADEAGHLEEIGEFRYTIRGTEFFTKILRFEK